MKITIPELVCAVVLSLMIGVAFMGWTMLFSLVRPFLEPFGFRYAINGFWLIGGLLPPLIIRKPGVALFSEILAGVVESIGSHWGISAFAWGFLQGLGAELVFMCFLYRRWDFLTLVLAAMLSALFSYVASYFYFGDSNLSIAFNAVQLLVFQISSVVFGAWPSWYVARRLVRTGLFNNFRIVLDKHKKKR